MLVGAVRWDGTYVGQSVHGEGSEAGLPTVKPLHQRGKDYQEKPGFVLCLTLEAELFTTTITGIFCLTLLSAAVEQCLPEAASSAPRSLGKLEGTTPAPVTMHLLWNY